ncbi:hypothetical protein SASPL_118044 [Salvia splendens]|uniref:Uncharacterized protein n=1 Tax=Salvia splendens TaxID=180675 RepID=A0A8X8Y0L3_SALSN|nr:hypothetical protein SASPL_118044 [Salvia splendens]
MEDGGPVIEEREHVDGLFTILSCLYAFGVDDFVPWLEVLDLDGHKRISEGDDILDILINLKNSENEPLLSIREIKALMVNAAEWAMAEMINQLDLLAKACEELDRVVGKNSTGRRGCPGIVLGSTMSTILLARLIQGFSWKSPHGTDNIDLAESSGDDGALAKPLIAHATPRLDLQIYSQLMGN